MFDEATNTLLHSIGGLKSQRGQAGQLSSPHAVAIDADKGLLYVVESGTCRVSVFTTTNFEYRGCIGPSPNSGFFARAFASIGGSTSSFSASASFSGSISSSSKDAVPVKTIIASPSSISVASLSALPENQSEVDAPSPACSTTLSMQPSGVVVDSAAALVYVADESKHRVMVFSAFDNWNDT